jgi:hypothetical protein
MGESQFRDRDPCAAGGFRAKKAWRFSVTPGSPRCKAPGDFVLFTKTRHGNSGMDEFGLKLEIH